jgi:hypothetical protein
MGKLGEGEPPHVVLVQGLAEVDDSDLENGWKRYFAGNGSTSVSGC